MTAIGTYIYNTFLGSYQQIIFPVKAFIVIRTMLKEGGFVVETPFVCKGSQLSYRTLLQLDADIMHYIPDITPYSNDEKAQAVLIQYRKTHQESINQIFKILESPQPFGDKLIDIITFGANVNPIFQAFIEGSGESFLISAFFVGGSLVFRKYIKPSVVKYTMKGVFAIAKKFLFRI
jgi:hypothetical protein